MDTPIGKKRFKVAKRLEEPSKFVVMRENEILREKAVSMAQFLAAMLMELEENTITFEIEDLETIHPHTVKFEFGDKTVTLSLTNPDEPDDGERASA